MTANKLEVTTHYQIKAAVLDLSGELTSLTGETLKAAYAEVQNQNPEVIFLNFAGVDYINSTGIAVIISLLAQARQTNRTLMAYGLRPFYAELFELAGLTNYLPILPAEAVQLEPA